MRGFFRGLRGRPRLETACPPVGGRSTTTPAAARRVRPLGQDGEPDPQARRIYKHEITAFLGNTAAALNRVRGPTRGSEPQGPLPADDRLLNPETVASYPDRLRIDRNLAYSKPGVYARLTKGLPNFDVRQCTEGTGAQLDPSAATDPAFTARTDGDDAEAQDFFDRLQLFAFGDQLATDDVPHPASCSEPAPFAPFGDTGTKTDYPHTLREP